MDLLINFLLMILTCVITLLIGLGIVAIFACVVGTRADRHLKRLIDLEEADKKERYSHGE